MSLEQSNESSPRTLGGYHKIVTTFFSIPLAKLALTFAATDSAAMFRPTFKWLFPALNRPPPRPFSSVQISQLAKIPSRLFFFGMRFAMNLTPPDGNHT